MSRIQNFLPSANDSVMRNPATVPRTELCGTPWVEHSVALVSDTDIGIDILTVSFA